MATTMAEIGQRPPISEALRRVADSWSRNLPGEALRRIAGPCLLNTLETTTFWQADGTSYVITGDIPALWLRDSSAQVETYLRWAGTDPVLQRTIRGLILMQAKLILQDPYANAFNHGPIRHEQFPDDQTDYKSPWMFERKYEIDSLCYPIRLLWRYLSATGDTKVCTPEVRAALDTIRATWRREQQHSANSGYFFRRMKAPPTDTLSHDGRGAPVVPTGMTWSGFRPSDDACTYGYLVPSNQFAVVVLNYMAQIYERVWHDVTAAEESRALRDDIDAGIRQYGIVDHPGCGRIFAYETDGNGAYNLMDDANCPSLLAAPYLGYCRADDPVYQNTRRFVLSSDNPFYHVGTVARGIGSPHTAPGTVWHLSLIMQGLTATDPAERHACLEMCLATDAGTGFMHESFNPSDPTQFSRPWFAWANTLFAELVLQTYGPLI
ncbi:MAG: glycoside hydrolase family 125 protein [Mycobacterium leprae]